MPAETDLLNGALGLTGNTPIVSIDDNTPNANYCKRFYPMLRKAYLRQHFWNFAEGRASLVQNVTPPAFEFAFAFDLPSDFIRMKEYNGAGLDTSLTDPLFMPIISRFKIEGRQILTNDGEVKIVYTKDVTNPDLWDSLFYQAFEAHLGSKLARAINRDVKLAESLLGDAVKYLGPIAMAVDGQEVPERSFIVDDLTWGR